ncbi:hypothetical protein GGS21DRAFT_494601 [Xylaria nigripes]|nr:hypothetical protein GGS21DRAFT_494601 [Xylaria nigripes]
MAPRTRSSTAAAMALDELKSAQQLGQGVAQISINPSRRGRGKLCKNRASIHPTGNSDSGSSTATQLTNTSDGEYSTPATSKAVTPAPHAKSSSRGLSVAESTATSDSSHHRPRRGRLTVELPAEVPSDDDVDYKSQTNGKEKPPSIITGFKRQHRHAPYNEDSDEYDDLYGNDHSASAVLARRLQYEEDQKFVADNHTISARKGSTFVNNAFKSNSALNRPDGAKRKRTLNNPNSLSPDDQNNKLDNNRLQLRLRKKPKLSASNTFTAVTTATAGWSSTVNAGNDPKVEIDDQESDYLGSDLSDSAESSEESSDSDLIMETTAARRHNRGQRAARGSRPVLSVWSRASQSTRAGNDRYKLEKNHPELQTMWRDLRNMSDLNVGPLKQPAMISLQLKPFQLHGVAWMKAMEKTAWKGGLLGDEMGLGKTIQAVSLIMSDYPAKTPTLVLLPPVALGQWQDEIATYTGNRLKTIVFHGTNAKARTLTAKELKRFDVIIMSYNSLESLYRKQEKGVKKEDVLYKEKSVIHQIKFHRVILDEAHCIKTRTTMTARACFALNVTYRWCLTGTPLQNRIGEFFSLIRFLEIKPYASYFCRDCDCSTLEWSMGSLSQCTHCKHASLRHISVFNQELLNPIQKYGNTGLGKEAFEKLRLLTSRIMLRRLKKDHTNVMELPVKEIHVNRQFFCEEETDLASSIMSNTERQFNTYVAQGVVLNNYANIFGLIMQMRQVADHPDLILKKSAEGGQNILVCCICDEPAEQAIRSKCRHDFCRQCATSYLSSQDEPDCPRCHIPLSIDLEQPSIEQDETLLKKSSIINRIKMADWTSSSKIELLVHELHRLRSDNASHKSIIFSQFTTMLQLIEWRLRRAGITTVMLDGSMTPAQRQASIKHFMEKPEVECFLVSLKAGGVALNLTEASQVFIVDPWWNPAAEWQSADRCHRIGQTRPCTITRLCIEDSVESRMVLLQEKKTHMIHSTINSDDTAMQSLNAADLSFLFRGH